MKATLNYARFEPSNANRSNDRMMWSEVRCSFSLSDREDRPQILIAVRQERDRDATYAELERRAQDQAVVLLREALAQLEAHPIGELNRPYTGIDIELGD